MNPIFLIIFILSFIGISAQNDNWNNYYNQDFNPFQKQDWFLVLSLGFQNSNSENDEFLFQEIINNHTRKNNFNFGGGYFIKPSFAFGGKVNYKFEKSEISFINSNSDTVIRKEASDRVLITPFIRNYIPISQNNRFNIYNDTELSFGFQSKVNREEKSPDEITKYDENTFITRLGISPGIQVFVVREFSFEMGLNLIGFEYEKVEKKYGTGKVGREDNFDFDFKISLLSLNLGLAYYF